MPVLQDLFGLRDERGWQFPRAVKTLCLVLACHGVCLSVSLAEAVKFGTIVVIAYSNDKVAVAADSRANFNEGGYRDDQCKIARFGDELIFANSGLAGFQSSSPLPGLNWTAHTEAKLVFDRVSVGTLAVPLTDIVATVAQGWGQNMVRQFTAALASGDTTVRQTISRQNGVLSKGLFVGRNRQGQFSILVVQVNGRNGIASLQAFRLTPRNEFRVAAISNSEIVQEYAVERRTERAVAEWNWWGNSLDAARVSAYAIRLVQLTIALHPKAGELGGPIDAIEMDRSGHAEWVQLKRQCTPIQ